MRDNGDYSKPMIRRLIVKTRSLHALPNFTGLLASTFALGIAFSFVAPFLSLWGLEEVGLSPTDFGLFMTATSICAMVASSLLGRLSDTTFSRRQMLLLGSSGGVCGFAGYALIRDPLLLVIVGCSLHALASICFAQLFSHAREVYQSQVAPGSSSFTLSVVRVCFSFAWTLGPAAGSIVLIGSGFRGLFLCAAALYLVFLLGTLKFVSPKPPISSGRQKPGESVFKTLLQPHVLICFLSFATIFAANAINMMNLPLAITRTLGGSRSDFGIVFGIGPLVEIPLMLWFGHLAGRGLQLPLIRIGMGLTLLYFAGLSLASATWHVYLLQILSGASFAILTNVAILFFQDLLPGQMGLATSVFSNAGAAGNLAGMLTFGLAVEALGHQMTFVACAGLATASLALMLIYRPGVGKGDSPGETV